MDCYDGDGDGVEDNYYFGVDGFMLHDTTTSDGYVVGSDGKWIKDNSNVNSGEAKIYTPDKESSDYQKTLRKQSLDAEKIRDKRKKTKNYRINQKMKTKVLSMRIILLRIMIVKIVQMVKLILQ